MATKIWRGDAVAVSQVNHITIAGTWANTEAVTVKINDVSGNQVKAFKLTVDNVAGRTVEEVVDAIISAWNSGTQDASFLLDKNVSEAGELAAITASKSGTTIVVLTADTPGVPFVQTSTEDAAAGTAVTTIPTDSSGPNHWDDAGNWFLPGGVAAAPIATDSVYIQDTDVDILYGLNQTEIKLALLQVDASFTGTIGLPRDNTSGVAYREYLPQYLDIRADAIRIGDGLGQGSGRIKLNVPTAASDITVLSTGSPLEQDRKSLLLRSMIIGGSLTVRGGSVEVCPHGGDTAIVTTLNASGSADVRIGVGTTLTTSNASGTATVEINVAVATRLEMQDNPTVTVQGSGTVAIANVFGGTINYLGTGTITTLLVGAGGIFDASNNPVGATVSSAVTATSGSTIKDPNQVINFSAGVTYQNCGLDEVAANYGRGFTVTLS